LLLFSGLGCPGGSIRLHGGNIPLLGCLLRFDRLCYPGSMHASRAGTTSCLLLFSYLSSPSLALTQVAVVPGSVKSMDSRIAIAMLDSNGARR
jgi:hypothetical protein